MDDLDRLALESARGAAGRKSDVDELRNHVRSLCKLVDKLTMRGAFAGRRLDAVLVCSERFPVTGDGPWTIGPVAAETERRIEEVRMHDAETDKVLFTLTLNGHICVGEILRIPLPSAGDLT